jgi:rubrerythrin
MTWVCQICGYEEDGDTPPEVCPVCSAEQSAFEPKA